METASASEDNGSAATDTKGPRSIPPRARPTTGHSTPLPWTITTPSGNGGSTVLGNTRPRTVGGAMASGPMPSAARASAPCSGSTPTPASMPPRPEPTPAPPSGWSPSTPISNGPSGPGTTASRDGSFASSMTTTTTRATPRARGKGKRVPNTAESSGPPRAASTPNGRAAWPSCTQPEPATPSTTPPMSPLTSRWSCSPMSACTSRSADAMSSSCSTASPSDSRSSARD